MLIFTDNPEEMARFLLALQLKQKKDLKFPPDEEDLRRIFGEMIAAAKEKEK